MERFVHNANIEHYRRLIAESEFDPSRDEDRQLLTLLAEEVAFRSGKGAAPLPELHSTSLLILFAIVDSYYSEAPRPRTR